MSDIVEVPKAPRIPPLPGKSWAAVVSNKPKPNEQVDTSIIDALQDKLEECENKLAGNVIEIDDLTERNKELTSQVEALQKSLEEMELRLAPEPEVVPTPEVAPEPEVADVVKTRWWFW